MSAVLSFRHKFTIDVGFEPIDVGFEPFQFQTMFQTISFSARHSFVINSFHHRHFALISGIIELADSVTYY